MSSVMEICWRLIVHGADDAFTNMAVDEAMLVHCMEGKSAPTLRFYEWEKPSISIGYAMEADREVNLSLCRERDVPVVRRITGGGLVFHKCDVTYTVVFPEDFASEPLAGPVKRLSVLESYRLVNCALAEGLNELGVFTSLLEREKGRGGRTQRAGNVCFSNPTVYDILHGERKLAGSAQRRKKGWVLHQGSMLFSCDFVSMCALVSPGGTGTMSSAAASSMAGTAVCLEEILGHRPEREKVVSVLSEKFASALGMELRRCGLTTSEMEMAERLREEKYSTDDWNLRRSLGATTRLRE